MAKTAKFEMPDGRVAKFEVPDNYTPAQAQSEIQRFVSKKSGPTLNIPEGPMQTGQVLPQQPLKQPIVPPLGVSPGQAIEPALAIGSGAVAESAAGLAGIASLPFGAKTAAENVEATRSALTYSPMSQAGEKGLKAVGETLGPAVEPLMRAEEALGEKGFEAGGPMLGAIARTLPTAALAVAGPALSTAGRRIAHTGRMAAKADRAKFVDDLVTPKKTKAVLKEEQARLVETGKGPFKKAEVIPSAEERDISLDVQRIKGISPNKTIHGNLNTLKAHNQALAKNLSARIGKQDAQIPHVAAKFDIDDAISKAIKDNPIIPVNAKGQSSMLDRFGAQAKKILDKHPQTAKGLLDARKEFDKFAQSQRANIFDTPQEPAAKIATFAIRDAMNNRIASAVPRFKNDLAKQSNLFKADYNMTSKAIDVPRAAMGRIWANAKGMFGARNNVMQGLAIATGTSVLGAATAFAPVISASVLGGGAILAGGKVLSAPQVRMILGKMIKLSGQALGKAKDKRVISQLKADRIALIESLKTMREREK